MPLGAARFGFLGAPDLGELQLIETKTLASGSPANTLDFSANNLTPYNVHFITYHSLINSGNAEVGFRFYENGVLESGSVYDYALQYGTTGGTFGESRSKNIPIS